MTEAYSQANTDRQHASQQSRWRRQNSCASPVPRRRKSLAELSSQHCCLAVTFGRPTGTIPASVHVLLPFYELVSCAQVPAHLQVQQSSHSAPSMGMPGYFNPYMAMQSPGMMPMGMPHPNMGPPNPLEAAAAHGFSSPSQFRPPPIDAARAHSLGSQQGSPLSPTGTLL